MRCGGASVVLSEQPPAFAGYPPDRPDPPRYRFMFSLLVKWPEKAVSESSQWLAQLIYLVQGERAECVTFPLSAVKVTHWTGAVLKNRYLVQFYGHAAAKPSAMQAAARYTEGADAPVQGASVFIVQIRSENHPAVQHQGVACRRSLQRSVSAWKASGRAPVFPFLQR